MRRPACAIRDDDAGVDPSLDCGEQVTHGRPPAGDDHVVVGVVERIEQHVDAVLVLGSRRAGDARPGGDDVRLASRDSRVDHVLEGGASRQHVGDAERAVTRRGRAARPTPSRLQSSRIICAPSRASCRDSSMAIVPAPSWAASPATSVRKPALPCPLAASRRATSRRQCALGRLPGLSHGLAGRCNWPCWALAGASATGAGPGHGEQLARDHEREPQQHRSPSWPAA